MTTLLDIKNHVKQDLDLEEETFIEDTDIVRWTNEAIAVAEGEIHTLYEDYFFVEADPVAISRGQNLVDYPSDIYANKIRKIIFTDGSGTSTASHEVRKVRDLVRAKEKDLYNNDTATPILTWQSSNDSTNGRKIRLYPSNGRSGFLHIFYIRNANKLSLDTDILDIDEFERFIIQYVKTQAYLKDGDPRSQDSKALEEQYKNQMILTLSDMAPDGNNEVELDLSHYEDSVGGC